MSVLYATSACRRRQAQRSLIGRVLRSSRFFLVLFGAATTWLVVEQADALKRIRLTDSGLIIAGLLFAVFLARITAPGKNVTTVTTEVDPPADARHRAPATIDEAERQRWCDTVVALLAADAEMSSHLTQNAVLLRVGIGVEIFVGDASLKPPACFEQGPTVHQWLVAPSLSIDQLEAMLTKTFPLSIEACEVGRDESTSYYLLASAPGSDEGDERPTPGLVVVDLGEKVVVEPFDLHLRKPPARATSELAARREAPEQATNEVADASRVEVRILRPLPDLVGDLIGEPTGAAVEFVAYLATHGYRATTAKLRDAIGTNRSRSSSSPKVVWNAVSEARRCLGPRLVPMSSGQQPYRLAEEVGCDWTRFQQLREVAKSSETEEQAIAALSEALELVEGIPAEDSNRFSWLDTEWLLQQISDAVLEASRRLCDLAMAKSNQELARFAIAKGRIFSPLAEDLTAIERELRENDRVREPA
jgi:predicted RNase H-like HicB family nuclease